MVAVLLSWFEEHTCFSCQSLCPHKSYFLSQSPLCLGSLIITLQLRNEWQFLFEDIRRGLMTVGAWIFYLYLRPTLGQISRDLKYSSSALLLTVSISESSSVWDWTNWKILFSKPYEKVTCPGSLLDHKHLSVLMKFSNPLPSRHSLPQTLDTGTLVVVVVHKISASLGCSNSAANLFPAVVQIYSVILCQG